jgi:adenylate cyclase
VRPVILICDDDPEIRRAMRRALRDYEVVEAGTPREALDALKARAFDAILCDYALNAETDGLDLLQHVRLVYPDTARFLLTGTSDIEVAARAINEGAVQRYFSKPWDEEKLRAALEIMVRSRQRGGS